MYPYVLFMNAEIMPLRPLFAQIVAIDCDKSSIKHQVSAVLNLKSVMLNNLSKLNNLHSTC